MKTLLFLISIFTLIACGAAPKSTDNQETKKPILKNPLVDTKWKINGAAFIHEDIKSYTLTPPSSKEKGFPDFGHFVEFSNDGTFRGYYSAQCGNDCFTSVDGKYTMENENSIKIFITKAANHGYCNDTLLIENKEMGRFEITAQNDKSYLLKRI